MKNYELISLLMEQPAGYDVEFGRAVAQEDLGGEDGIFAAAAVTDAEISDAEKKITLISTWH